MNLFASLGVSASTFVPDTVPPADSWSAPDEVFPPEKVQPKKRLGRPKGSKNLTHRKDFVLFVLWAAQLKKIPLPEQVTARFPEPSHATVHRWLNLLAEAMNVERPKRNSHGDVIPTRGQA